MERFRFGFYYINLRLKVAFGLHRTSNPLGIRWRWRFWQRRHESLMKLW